MFMGHQFYLPVCVYIAGMYCTRKVRSGYVAANVLLISALLEASRD